MRRSLVRTSSAANRWIAEHADILSWTPPRGGLLALLRYNIDITSLDLANKLAEEYSVRLAPGSAFGFEHHLRIGIGQEPYLCLRRVSSVRAPALPACRQTISDRFKHGERAKDGKDVPSHRTLREPFPRPIGSESGRATRGSSAGKQSGRAGSGVPTSRARPDGCLRPG